MAGAEFKQETAGRRSKARGRKPAGNRIAAALPLLAAITLGVAQIACTSTQEEGGIADPIVGTVVSGAGKVTVSRQTFIEQLAASDVIFLGEKHDNPWHHQRQHEVVLALIERGKRPSIALEALSVEQTSAVMSYIQASERSSRQPHGDMEQNLRNALGWGNSDSPQWRRRGPLLVLARKHGLTVFGIDLPLALRRRISAVGIDGLTPAESRLLDELQPVSARYRGAMLSRLKAAHCGFGSDAYLARLFQNWVARNERMARTIAAQLREAEAAPAVVIVGTEHVRFDEGVVRRLRGLNGSVTHTNVGLQAVQEPALPAAAYVDEDGIGDQIRPAHGFYWFTPRGQSHGDPCERLRHIMQNKNARVRRTRDAEIPGIPDHLVERIATGGARRRAAPLAAAPSAVGLRAGSSRSPGCLCPRPSRVSRSGS